MSFYGIKDGLPVLGYIRKQDAGTEKDYIDGRKAPYTLVQKVIKIQKPDPGGIEYPEGSAGGVSYIDDIRGLLMDLISNTGREEMNSNHIIGQSTLSRASRPVDSGRLFILIYLQVRGVGRRPYPISLLKCFCTIRISHAINVNHAINLNQETNRTDPAKK